MKYFCCILILLVSFSFCEAQKKTKKLEKIEFKRYAIGVSPSAILNFYPAIQLSHDFGITKRINLALETGYIYGGPYADFTQGFRVKQGVQFMAASSEHLAVNFGLSYFARYTYAPREFIYNYWEDQYFELVKVDRTKIFHAGEFSISLLVALTNHLRLEFGAGLGAGQMTVEDKNSTQSREGNFFQQNEWNFNPFERVGVYPYVLTSFNVNVNYILVWGNES